MRFFSLALSLTAAATIALATGAARADDNPYHPAPIPVTETADHGQGTYCTKQPLPNWTCSQELSANGGPGGPYHDPTSAEKQAYGAAHQPKKI